MNVTGIRVWLVASIGLLIFDGSAGVQAATFNGSPIVLTGNQTLTISDPDYILKNNITLLDSSTLIIRNSTFSHLSDYNGQFSLAARGNSRVVIEDSILKSSSWVNWRFFDDATLELHRVDNRQSNIWHGFQQRARAIARDTWRFNATMAEQNVFDIERIDSSYIEAVFPPGAVVDEAFPATVNGPHYFFPNERDRGIATSLRMAGVRSSIWGITYVPDTDVTIRDTNGVTVTFNIPRTYSGLTATFDNLKATLYDDATWTTGRARLRLVNTTALPWSPIVAGNNQLVMTNSELADQSGSLDRAHVSIADSTMSYTLASNFVRIDIARSFVKGDVVARENGVITITDSGVAGRLIQEGNGLIVAAGVVGLGRGFVISHGGLTGHRAEVISGRTSIKGAYFGTQTRSRNLHSVPEMIRLSASRTYRLTFRYRIITAASNEFDVGFYSNKAIAAGSFLPSLRITGQDGDTDTATLIADLGPYDDYQAIWTTVGTGAIVIDDIQIVDDATGLVIASEGGESPVVVERVP